MHHWMLGTHSPHSVRSVLPSYVLMRGLRASPTLQVLAALVGLCRPQRRAQPTRCAGCVLPDVIVWSIYRIFHSSSTPPAAAVFDRVCHHCACCSRRARWPDPAAGRCGRWPLTDRRIARSVARSRQFWGQVCQTAQEIYCLFDTRRQLAALWTSQLCTMSYSCSTRTYTMLGRSGIAAGQF